MPRLFLQNVFHQKPRGVWQKKGAARCTSCASWLPPQIEPLSTYVDCARRFRVRKRVAASELMGWESAMGVHSFLGGFMQILCPNYIIYALGLVTKKSSTKGKSESRTKNEGEILKSGGGMIFFIWNRIKYKYETYKYSDVASMKESLRKSCISQILGGKDEAWLPTAGAG